MKFLNKVVVITGGASGIGFSAARLFAEQGAIVAINDVRGEAAEKAAAEICAQGGKAFPIPGDVSDIEVVRKNVADVIGKHGRIDVLVNNAAMITLGPAETVPIDAWNKTLAVNVSGAFFWAQTVAAQSMLPNRSGVIINIASIAGLVGGPNMVCYIATKHAVVGLTKALALEWGRRGIRVNALCPGLTETDMVKAVRREKPAMFEVREKRIPLGRVATPEDQAHAILFMSSPEATSVHGLIMNVDGGQVAMSSGYSLDD